jgi:hypothetical protein
MTDVLSFVALSRHGMPLAVFEQMSVAETVTVPSAVNVLVAFGNTTVVFLCCDWRILWSVEHISAGPSV